MDTNCYRPVSHYQPLLEKFVVLMYQAVQYTNRDVKHFRRVYYMPCEVMKLWIVWFRV